MSTGWCNTSKHWNDWKKNVYHLSYTRKSLSNLRIYMRSYNKLATNTGKQDITFVYTIHKIWPYTTNRISKPLLSLCRLQPPTLQSCWSKRHKSKGISSPNWYASTFLTFRFHLKLVRNSSNFSIFIISIIADYIGCYIQSGDKEEWGNPNKDQMLLRRIEIQNLK